MSGAISIASDPKNNREAEQYRHESEVHRIAGERIGRDGDQRGRLPVWIPGRGVAIEKRGGIGRESHSCGDQQQAQQLMRVDESMMMSAEQMQQQDAQQQQAGEGRR